MRNGTPETPQTDEQTTPSSDERSKRIDRRQFLGAIGASGLVASAGCLTTLPAFGQRVRFGEVSEPAFGPPQYQTWIPALRDDVVDQVDDVASVTSVEYVEPGNMGAELLGAPYGGDRVKRMMEYVGIEFEAFDWVVTAQGDTVASASVDRDAVEATLARTGYERDGTYQGYDLYRRTDTRRVLGIAEDRVLFNGYIEEPYRYLKRVIDAGAGRTARRYETDDDFAQMTAAVAARPVTLITGGRFEIDGTEAVLQAETLSTDGSSVYPGRLFLFPVGHDVSRGDIEQHIEQFPEALDATRVSVSVDGRIVSGIAEMTPETFLQLEDVYERPLITWGVEFAEDADEVTVR